MIRFFYLQMIIIFSLAATAQQIDRTVIATAGDNMLGVDVQLEWTLGETIVETFSNDEIMLTQGFQQGEMIILNVSEQKSINVSVFPNPTFGKVNIQLPEKSDFNLKLYSLNGACLLDENLEGDKHIVSIDKFAAGIYLVNLMDNKTNTNYQYKINKLK